MKSFIIAIFAAIIAIAGASAQPSGYLGKLNSIRYDNFCRPVITYLVDEYPDDAFFLRSRHGVSYERVVSRSHIWGASLQYYQFIAGDDWNIYENESVDLEYSNTGQLYVLSGKFVISGYNAAIYLKKYGLNWIAPLGAYTRFGLMYNYYKTPSLEHIYISDGMNNYPDVENLLGNDNIKIRPDFLDNAQQSFHNATIFVSFGVERVIKKRFVFDWGVEGGIVGVIPIITKGYFDTDTEKNFTEHALGRRVTRAHILNFHFAFGYLF